MSTLEINRSEDVRGWIEAALFFALALAIRLPHLDHPGFYDEYYHTLAARSLLETGSFRSEIISYERAASFSQMVAMSFRLFGEGLAAARVPALLSGCALVVATWAFGRRVGGVWAGRFAALLLCFDPDAVYFSQLARFYTTHALVVLAAGAMLFIATSREPGLSPAWRITALAASGALFLFASHLNLLTAFAVLAFLAASAVDLAPSAARLWRRDRRFRRLAPVAAILFGVIAWINLPDPAWLFRYYLGPSQFAAERQFDFAFFLRVLGGHFPVLCALMPLAVLFGLRRYPRFTVFAAVAFAVGFALHSGAGRKEERYLLWAIPLFYLILGVGAATARPHVEDLVRERIGALQRVGARVTVRTASALLAAAMVFVALGLNPSFRMTLGMLATPTKSWPGPYHRHQPAQWEAATPLLEELLTQRCVLVSSAGVKALQHLRRLDYDLLRSLREEQAQNLGSDHDVEFVLDPRTHRPIVSEVGSIEELERRHASGMVVVDEVHWGSSNFVTGDVAAHLEDRFERVDVPQEWRMRVYVWGEPRMDDACVPRGPG
jgi:hypothetical protein